MLENPFAWSWKLWVVPCGNKTNWLGGEPMDFNNLNEFSLEFSRSLQQTGWIKSAASCCSKKLQELFFLYSLFRFWLSVLSFWCAAGIDREVWRKLNVSKGQGLLLGENKNKYSWCSKHLSPGAGCGFTCATGTSGNLYQFRGGTAGYEGLEAGRWLSWTCPFAAHASV